MISQKSADGIVAELRSDGFAVAPDVFDAAACMRYRQAVQDVYQKRLATTAYIGSNQNTVLYNYFVDSEILCEVLGYELQDAVMRRLIDDDYVLTSASARNRSYSDSGRPSNQTSGIGWHTDTRYVAGVRIQPSLSYFAILALEDYTAANGATEYVPGSHLHLKRPERAGDFPFRPMEARAGSVIFMDSALWHRAGQPSQRTRWSIFNMYSPWFMKPYWNFPGMMAPERAAALSPLLRQLLHFDSIVPRDENERIATLRRVNA